MTFRSFCDSQIHTKENPKGYDCLTAQLEGHNCVCPHTSKNLFYRHDEIIVAKGVNSEGGLDLVCHEFEIHPEFLKQIGQPPYDPERLLRALAETPEAVESEA